MIKENNIKNTMVDCNSDKCTIIKNNFLLDDIFSTNKKNAPVNKNIDDIFNGFCNLNKDNEIIVDFRYFKLLKTQMNVETDFMIQHIINIIKKALIKNKLFVMHVCLKSLSIADADKYYNFICKISEILKNAFPDKLEKCLIYNAPCIFSQLVSIFSAFVDKKTMGKLEMIN